MATAKRCLSHSVVDISKKTSRFGFEEALIGIECVSAFKQESLPITICECFQRDDQKSKTL
jgi:hypothetical protein